MDAVKIKEGIRLILEGIGEDLGREPIKGTPERVAEMFKEILAGYETDEEEILKDALFEAESRGLVVVKDIEFYSLCEHHMLPFFGKVHIGYLPGKYIIGLSKFSRIVDLFSKRLQVQERMTKEIAEFIYRIAKPVGVQVIVQGYHLCSIMRGVKKSGHSLITTAKLGLFEEDKEIEKTFLMMLGNSFKSGQWIM